MGTKKEDTNGVHHRALKGLIHVFMPHAGNDFHPHLIRPVGLVAVGLIVGMLYGGATSTRVESVKGESTYSGISKETLLEESNKVRMSEAVTPLKLNNDLSLAANLKARDMLVRDYWDHTAPDGTTPWYWYREVNYRYDFAGENLAKGFVTSPAVLTGWMNSEEHRNNALNKNYEDVGFGIAEGDLNGEETVVVVAMYGSPVGSPVLSEPSVLAATASEMSLATRFGIGLQSLNPMALASIVILLVTFIVALATYAFRKKFPVGVKKDWKRHHALYKALLTACLMLLLITVYGDGQLL